MNSVARAGVADAVLNAPLTTTPPVAVFTVLAVFGLAVLLGRRKRRWLLQVVPAAIAVAAVLVIGAAIVIEKVWRPFPDALPRSVYGWSGLAVLAVILVVARPFLRRAGGVRPLSAATLVVAAVAVVVAAAAHINATYDAYPTVRAALGVNDYRTVPFGSNLAPPGGHRAGQTKWSPPADLPAAGAVTSTAIPGTVSAFPAREARIYLPPAYLTDSRPTLPVLVLLAGQPGTPADWLVSGRLPEVMDRYAAGHDGLAPIVVVADGTGSQFGNPLCVDSHLGNVATYLTVDVPAWVRTHLQVDPDPRAWAVGGLSYGGTCALQLATTRPDVYPTFLNLSGQAEPTLGDRARTVREVFAGDAQAFARNDPAELLTHRRYPDSAGAFVVGLGDTEYRAGIENLYTTAQAAGMDVHLTELPGSHSWDVWSAGLEKEMPWLSSRLGVDGV